MTGTIIIAGLGPGADDMITPEVRNAINSATDIIGYIPYVARIAPRAGLSLHPSDNTEELDRAAHAFELAANGHRVVIVSSGDPGVFAMAAAVFEVLETASEAYKAIDIQVLPGITAMLAAAAACGAPLGHDFCCINLSDNLKPFSLIEKRVSLALEGDFAMAFYNPRSKSRPHGFEKILALLQAHTSPDQLIIFARAVSTKAQEITITSIAEAQPDMADMRTVVIVGAKATRTIETPDRRYISSRPVLHPVNNLFWRIKFGARGIDWPVYHHHIKPKRSRSIQLCPRACTA